MCAVFIFGQVFGALAMSVPFIFVLEYMLELFIQNLSQTILGVGKRFQCFIFFQCFENEIASISEHWFHPGERLRTAPFGIHAFQGLARGIGAEE